MEPKQQRFSIGYFIAALIALLLLQSLLFAPHAETLSYSEFKGLVKKGTVSNLVIDKQAISGTLAVDGLEGILPRRRSIVDGRNQTR
jgi:cell division protease FtsH